MSERFGIYFQNSLYISVFASLFLVFSPLLARRYSAKCRYYTWLVFFIALVFPVRPEMRVSPPVIFWEIIPQNNMAGTILDTVTSGNSIVCKIEGQALYHTAGLLWSIGALCFLCWHIFQNFRFAATVRRWSEDAEPDVLEAFAHAKADLRMKAKVSIQSCACIKTPMMAGLLRPVILVPRTGLPPDGLPLILKHELVHFKRKDMWYKALILLALSIHWFNPMVYLMAKIAMGLCEISCDEAVLQEVDAKGRARYGETIINVTRKRNSYRMLLATGFYSGAKDMKKRVHAIMDMKSRRFSPILPMLVITVILCGITTIALSSAQTQGSMQEPPAITDHTKNVEAAYDNSQRPFVMIYD